MKCANETVTIELKNGMFDAQILCFSLCIIADKLINRHNRTRHHHLRLALDEHSLANGQDDPSWSRPYLSGHHEHPWLYDSILYPSRLPSPGHPTHRRLGQAQEQGAQGSSGQRWPRCRTWPRPRKRRRPWSWPRQTLERCRPRSKEVKVSCMPWAYPHFWGIGENGPLQFRQYCIRYA